MTQTNRRRGFTLVEMLVVIAIIVVLVAILFPVFANARHKARMVRCQTNLSDLTQALSEYKRQWHRYPPQPAYDTAAQMYTGGFSALYPDFISDYSTMICPDDKTVTAAQDEARARRYCSYNGRIELAEDLAATAEDRWPFAVDADTGNSMVTYNYNGYDEKGWDRTAANALTPPAAAPTWLERGWRAYPRLANIYAPEYTVVTHCTFHRDFYSRESEQRDPYVQLTNRTDTLLVESWQTVGTDGASMFEKQDL